METLAIVAYLQPVTRSGVASVRGVNSDSSINSLVEKGLVREAGVADAPGNPTLYATTRAFLEKFGLRSTADLPDLDQFAPDDDTRAFIRERLSATREDAFVADDARLDGDEADPLDGVRFELDDEGPGSIAESPREEAASDAAQQMLAEAMASGFGLVEKIDFDKLTFEKMCIRDSPRPHRGAREPLRAQPHARGPAQPQPVQRRGGGRLRGPAPARVAGAGVGAAG